jgi:hypothetical protein
MKLFSKRLLMVPKGASMMDYRLALSPLLQEVKMDQEKKLLEIREMIAGVWWSKRRNY